MVDERIQLPDEVAALQEMVHSLTRHYEAELSKRDTIVSACDNTIAVLEEKMHLLLSGRFGTSSEKVSEAQLGLFNEAEASQADEGEASEPAAEIEVPGPRRAKPKRKPLPEHLPGVVAVNDLREEDKFCAYDGAALKLMSEAMFEYSGQLDIVPAQIRMLHHQRRKYRCQCCQAYIKTAPMTLQPIPKSLASTGLLAYVATAKFVDALPLHRQVRQFERIGVRLSRSPVANSDRRS